MPSINDIVQVAESLEKSPVAVLRDRCVAVRNRNASCRKCVEACQVGAISVSANEVALDAGACMACGACTAVCPTEALVPLQPTDPDLARAAASAASKFGGRALIACARIASKHRADPSLYAEVPCLARVEESVVASLVAHGASSVELVDGGCSTCKYRACGPYIDATVAYSNAILEAHGASARVSRTSQFPEEARIESAEGLFGSTRRGFFADAAGAAKETALTAARTTIEQELGYSKPEASIGTRLRVGENGVMPQLKMARHEVTINATDAIGWPVAETLETRRFAVVDINLDKCNACGMCAVFCSTGAIRRADNGTGAADLKRLEFSASECVQCGLCADVCWKGALTLSAVVPTAQLFDFEPRTFDLASVARKSAKPFGVGSK